MLLSTIAWVILPGAVLAMGSSRPTCALMSPANLVGSRKVFGPSEDGRIQQTPPAGSAEPGTQQRRRRRCLRLANVRPSVVRRTGAPRRKLRQALNEERKITLAENTPPTPIVAGRILRYWYPRGEFRLPSYQIAPLIPSGATGASMPLYKTAGITGQFSHAAGSACGGRASTLSFAFHLPANATLVLSPNSRCSSSGLAMNSKTNRQVRQQGVLLLPLLRGKSLADDHSDGSGRDDHFDEEEELTRSLHQGELDQFVLKWRLAVRALNRASTGNNALRACRIHDAVVRITKDAIARPTAWPQYRQHFVKDLLEKSWHA